MAITETEPVGPVEPLTAEDLEGDLIQPGHPLFGIVWVNPGRMGGLPCFSGSRVPIDSLFHYLEAGDTVEIFLDAFPPITRAQVVTLLELAQLRILDGLVRP